jgi:hypothetical protein
LPGRRGDLAVFPGSIRQYEIQVLQLFIPRLLREYLVGILGELKRTNATIEARLICGMVELRVRPGDSSAHGATFSS